MTITVQTPQAHVMSKKYNLGHINNLEDLHQEIRQVKVRIRQRETDFKDRWKRLPEESIKATLGSIIPFFLRNKVAGTTWTLIKSALSLVKGAKTKSEEPGDWKSFLLGNVKQLGIIAALKGVVRLVNRKRSSGKE